MNKNVLFFMIVIVVGNIGTLFGGDMRPEAYPTMLGFNTNRTDTLITAMPALVVNGKWEFDRDDISYNVGTEQVNMETKMYPGQGVYFEVTTGNKIQKYIVFSNPKNPKQIFFSNNGQTPKLLCQVGKLNVFSILVTSIGAFVGVPINIK
ncbi:MAG TPA: hypothetical protein VEK38_02770 [Candidatus Bathyarchaeia archaeon]|nr:hypothetical protein [Candidatus Bathyarchaeia archaeon]